MTPVTRERKKQNTREALIASAMELFALRGYDAVTVDDIAAHAGVSRRTAFRYFPKKDMLAFPRQPERLELFRELLGDGNDLTAVRTALLGMAPHYTANRDEALAQYRMVQASPALIGREIELDVAWEQAIAEALTDRSPIAARFWAGAAVGLTRAVLREWFAHGAVDDLHTMAGDAMTILQDTP
ncbi:MAG: TetR family transcriptional regulator [Proteobacteria bacterium]|nr:TetR family transcriptional regulator [Pseudomonadota bacterium]MCP4918127.1 TetR family transcriptional regulator [Pseudomonadota bacterium]